MSTTPLRAEDFATLADVEDWRFVLGEIHAEFIFDSFAAAAAFVGAVGATAAERDNSLDLMLRSPGAVRVRTTDVDLARAISALSHDAGATSVPLAVQGIEIAIDTMDVDRIRPFWAAVLGYDLVGQVALEDPKRLGPPVWFQQMDAPRTERQRFHIDVSVPHDVAAERIAAALAAGGRVVTDRFARSWWVLADADGNEACVCTWQDRG